MRGSGTSPGSSSGKNPLPSGFGIAWISAFVYGCRGSSQISCVFAISTILPKYMTAVRSEICRTTERSCEIKIMLIPSSATSSTKRFATCACADASSALIGSSAMITSGCKVSARAIAIRCRCPPLNWCVYLVSVLRDKPTRSRSFALLSRASSASIP